MTWRPHPQLGNIEVSDAGYVRLIGATAPSSVSIVDGYQVKYLLGAARRVHRLVLETFVGPCPTGMECRHLNGERADNRLSNLAWGTVSENADDRRLHGTSMRGETVKLTRENECDIKNQYFEGCYMGMLADFYNVHVDRVRQICIGAKLPKRRLT